MSNLQMSIDGESVTGESSFDVVNPSTGQVFAEVPACTAGQLDRAVRSAEAAFSKWRICPLEQRSRKLMACADVLEASREALARMLTCEQGKPIRAARYEVDQTALWFRYFAGLDQSDRVIVDDAQLKATVVRQPIGVVAAITPWNFPLLLAAMKIAPALATGNTVVLKPSPFTPLATLMMGQLLNGVLPPGVLNVVSGDNAVGVWMTGHPAVRKVSFTGSVATGKAVARAAADDLKRVTLELGGNDAAILLDDANPAKTAKAIVMSAFANGGQVCAGIKRVYVPDHLHDAIVEAMVAAVKKIKVGDGLDEAVHMGPVCNRPQFERVKELVADARAQGATFAAGGTPLEGNGYFFPPALLTGLQEGSRIVDEEQFGPALPVLRYRDVNDAISRANASHFGLSASVWGEDVERAQDIAAQLECGSVYINTHLLIRPDMPFGGVKWSGLGVENGEWALDAYTHPRAVYVNRH
jgi:acyl-CoA reductase-like NAD-dependent aldehyde dehydrogenase